MKNFKYLSIVLLLSSCVENKSCEPNYIGTYSIDMSLVVDSFQKKEILKRSWDTVKLISDSTGKYYFNNNDPILKESEGKWYTKSNDIEGNCVGYIKQKNLSGPYSGSFGIIVKISDSTNIRLPFKKVK